MPNLPLIKWAMVETELGMESVGPSNGLNYISTPKCLAWIQA